MYGRYIYEKEVSSASLVEFILGTEKVLYGFIRVWFETISSEVNAKLKRKQKHKNYAQSLMPTHVAREKYHWSESSKIQWNNSLKRVSVTFHGTKRSFTDDGLNFKKDPIWERTPEMVAPPSA
jgi:hypothetical protein